MTGFAGNHKKYNMKWPMERANMHTEIFEPLFYHQIQSSQYRTLDPDHADTFATPYLLSYPPYTKLTGKVIPFINKTHHYIDRYGGVDHFFIHVVFCSSYFSVGFQEQKYLPYSLSIPDLHWGWSVSEVRHSWRTTIIPYTSNQELDPIEKNISIFFIGTMSPSFLGGTGKKVRKGMLPYLENISNSLAIKTLRHDKKKHVANFNISKLLRQSVFCAVPMGDSPSSKRLFDSLRARCVPIVLSDEIRFPFEETMINYRNVVTQIDMMKPEMIEHVMMLMNDRKRRHMHKEMEQLDDILDISTDKDFKLGDQTWAFLWFEYIKASIVASVKRRTLLESCYF